MSMTLCPAAEYAGYSTIIVYPAWPRTDHPSTVARHVVRGLDGAYEGPDALEPASFDPLSIAEREKAAHVPQTAAERYPIVRITPQSLALAAEKRARAQAELEVIKGDFAGAGPGLPALPVSVAFFDVRSDPFDYCGVPVSRVAVVPIAGSMGAAVALADVHRANAHVHVLLFKEPVSYAVITRHELIARRVGLMSPTHAYDPDSR